MNPGYNSPCSSEQRDYSPFLSRLKSRRFAGDRVARERPENTVFLLTLTGRTISWRSPLNTGV